ncbi:MAG: hypothetical protein ACRCX8_01500 [Sarcina sp.]
MTTAEAERINQLSDEERQEKFKQDLLLMGATLEEVEERYQRIWGND